MSLEKITPQEAKKQLDTDNNIVLLDVRSENEYNAAHIKHSINLRLGDVISEAENVINDKNAKIFVYCLSGVRSKKAAKLLDIKGYTKIFDMGGINDWPYEVEKGE